MEKHPRVDKRAIPLEIVYSVFLGVKDKDTGEKVYIDDVLQARQENGNPYPCISPYRRVSLTWDDLLYYVIENGYGYIVQTYQ